MGFKHFRINCTLRILSIGALIYIFSYLAILNSYPAVTIVTGLLILYLIYALIHYVEQTNRDLIRFLEAVKYADFSQSFSPARQGFSFDRLRSEFNTILEKFRIARAEKEQHFRYLQTVVQHIGTGLIVFCENGNVDLINTAAKRILQINTLKHMNDISHVSPALATAFANIQPSHKQLLQINDIDERLQLAIYATEFRIRGENFRLISIQNIQSELEEKEMESWQNLIRVLTHEIMNSITPIASLASTANDILKTTISSAATAKNRSTNYRDICDALETIKSRSDGLLHFVQAYRNLSRIPEPVFQNFVVSEMLIRTGQLLGRQLKEAGVKLKIEVIPQNMQIWADPELIEQVIINLIMNAIHALEPVEHGQITIKSYINNRSRAVIMVTDNGPGIIEEVQEKIFIPFFTTRQGGSGIGLSLSRQIMRLHRGSISVRSLPDKKTAFSLRF